VLDARFAVWAHEAAFRIEIVQVDDLVRVRDAPGQRRRPRRGAAGRAAGRPPEAGRARKPAAQPPQAAGLTRPERHAENAGHHRPHLPRHRARLPRGALRGVLEDRHARARHLRRALRAAGAGVHRAVAAQVSEIVNGRYLLDYALGSLLVFFIAFAWGWWRQGKSFTLSSLCGLGMASSNSGYIGYPIAVPAIGAEAAAVALAMCMLVENLLMIPLVLVMADSGSPGTSRGSARCATRCGCSARNPIVLAIVAGFGVALLECRSRRRCRRRSTCWRCRRPRSRCS
jgi:hypothetical protein